MCNKRHLERVEVIFSSFMGLCKGEAAHIPVLVQAPIKMQKDAGCVLFCVAPKQRLVEFLLEAGLFAGQTAHEV